MNNIRKIFKKIILKSKIGKCRFKRIILNARRDIYYETIVEMDKKGCDNIDLYKVIDQLNLLTMKTVIQFDIELDLLGELSRV